jgi:putative flippase GtrA
MILVNNSKERNRFMRFAVVGVIGAIVDFGTMNLLVGLFKAPFLLAGTISFICAILSNFTWNRYWTYPDSRSKRIRFQIIQFAVVSVVGLTLRTPILAFLEPIMLNFFDGVHLPVPVPLFDHVFLAHNLTLAIAVITVMFWNFFANRYWTYGDVDQKRQNTVPTISR